MHMHDDMNLLSKKYIAQHNIIQTTPITLMSYKIGVINVFTMDSNYPMNTYTADDQLTRHAIPLRIFQIKTWLSSLE